MTNKEISKKKKKKKIFKMEENVEKDFTEADFFGGYFANYI